MLNTKFSPWPSFTQAEADAVSNVILSNKVNYWTGQEGRQFEKEFAEYTESKYAVALGNGTQALDLALIALDVGPGDEIIVTPRTFLASVSSVVTAGATPVFVDVDRDSQNIEAPAIEKAITKKTKAVVVVHLAGRPADMDPIMSLAEKHGFYVIEDCAQAHGAKYRGCSVGSIGHIGAWSFCQDKIMTTGGEGGMVTTNDEALWRKMWSYKDHGKSYEAVYEREHPPGFRWLHESFGTNWRMTEVQAAIGRIQLTHMPEWTQNRQKNAEAITEVCSEFNCVRTPVVPEHMEHACYKHYCFVKPENLAEGWTRDRIVNEIVERGVPCMQGSCSEVYLEKAFDGTGYRPEERLAIAKELGETSLMFLVHPTLTDSEIEKTCVVIKDVLSQAQS
ncbi:dTDP-4-amino-4,6-dideoxygalactose transaminase [Idiomarina loihiensis]|jgi:dTDP-4-amino-4,6-dideoxygalactose transaminase|uniref:DegT/DnrJ/EryC1/StrS family aminotransferase n=1 Tax=Idiomarina TaxID=135575 RepID=UPI000D71B760|nr:MULTISPECIES: DegT/DnrJ/EryC1/StrS aminotransferase family protein [Idiomarina]PWW37694.1 dTDP-4-amino-4,6-dideoxygalactose transaminase [Idiomarina loihiensis]TDP47399.1 dTDP-4-amino-4,6-dideoxygalactose transaminase [Idiomarina loihiensis]TDS23140.1 dTDP-4-amino-4,6-dideoxygalactose transaminase [Idiomarina sp. H2]